MSSDYFSAAIMYGYYIIKKGRYQKMLKKKNIKQFMIEGVGAIWFFLTLVSTIVLIVLNCTPVYHYVINKYGLTIITGLSEEKLMLNYKAMISYLQRPGGDILQLPDFPMSETGMIHFADVKNIFMGLYTIVLLFVIAMIIYVVIKHHDKDKCILSIFNKGANLVFIVFGLLICMITFSFSKTFTMFHKLFFRNDYWVFDYRVDPVILALPEELFMILSIMIISLLFITSVIIKVTYHKSKRMK